MVKNFLAILLLVSMVPKANAQEDSLNNERSKKPNIELGLRSYFMSTGYWQDFKGDHAWGQSAFLRVKTQSFHGFSLTASYAVFGKILSSDLSAREPRTGATNRYEIGLFDVLDAGNNFFGKVEDLHLTFQSKKLTANVGRMGINTPFINPQDGRLEPTFVEGLRLNYKPNSRLQFGGDLIWRMSPRSTSGWFRIGETIGVYPIGRNEFGAPSAYFGNTFSDFVSVTDLRYRLPEEASLQLNHTLVQNISSTYLAEFQKEWKAKVWKNSIISGFQGVVQHGIGEGGNQDPALRYKNPEDINYIWGARIGLKNDKMVLHLNYTSIKGSGRFLSPREWGKDPFFTFIPRERNEGFSKVDALTLFIQRSFPERSLQLSSHVGLHFLPSPTNFLINKYAFPSYAQMNLAAKYAPKNWGKGLDFHLILMTKKALDQSGLQPGWIYNKVNLLHLDMILNYRIQWNEQK
ncbi:hypothetical protein P872_18585 [Rhodonellum psychrophilum GCM71 = DSM 17998]|uniref:Porin n=2 Tax=Rhodonellum TaxID=336827 RepID=U5BWQ4_9BACT|nr:MULTISPECIES: hypothetical protein [Rhodonellum]ERM82298.1 hypothetical protein P872_18585 [Rhodonellum psychrophilum GCM71 = DSM 17998]SDZ49060.1 hypothetical protein SAMN05444412_11749 [Rhodonellum ikkaensis]